MIPYNKNNIPLAKNLRKNMTPWERKLWYQFLRSYPIRFQRQKAIGRYIVDFYCARARLVVELDGGGHYQPTQHKNDILRSQSLEKTGLTVLRIANNEIDRNFKGVCVYIDLAVRNSLLPPQAVPLPRQREVFVAPSDEGAVSKAD